MKKREFKAFKNQLLEAIKVAYRKNKLDFLLKDDNKLQKNIVMNLLSYEGIPYIGYLLKELYLVDVYIHSKNRVIKYDLYSGDIISEYNYSFKRIEIDFYSIHLYI